MFGDSGDQVGTLLARYDPQKLGLFRPDKSSVGREAPSGLSAFTPFLEITGFRELRDCWHGVGGPDGASLLSIHHGFAHAAGGGYLSSVVSLFARGPTHAQPSPRPCRACPLH